MRAFDEANAGERLGGAPGCRRGCLDWEKSQQGVELLATPEKDTLFQLPVNRRAAAAQLGVYPCNHLQIEPLSGSLKVSKAYTVNHTSADSQKSWQYWGCFPSCINLR
jgi:hypothetical protein